MTVAHPSISTSRGWRLALAIFVLMVGGWITAASLAKVLVRADPGVAHALAPSDGRVTAAYALALFRTSAADSAGLQPESLAKAAVQSDATAVQGLTVLGLSAELRSDAARARKILAFSSKLSRRELEPRLSAIETAVNKGDIPGALRQYDLALRVSRDARGTLFPVLGSAITEPKIRRELVTVLLTQPNWGPEFLGYLATNGKDPTSGVLLMEEGARRNLPISMTTRAALVSALVQKEQFDQAWRYYATLGRGADRTRSRDANLSARIEGVTPFDWTIGPDNNAFSTIARAASGGAIEFALPPGQGGIVARQMQMLAPGSYQLSGTASDIEQDARVRPYWSLTCAGSMEMGRVTLGVAGADPVSFSRTVVVPPLCPVQYLELVVPPSNGVAGSSGQVERVLIRRQK